MSIHSICILTISILIEDIKNVIEIAAIVVGGVCAVYHFGLFRERFPSMEILNGINYIGENSKENLIELYCVVENKGKVRKWIAPFDFKLKSLSSKYEFVRSEEISWQVKLKDLETSEGKSIERRYWVSPDWYIPFVDGQSKRSFQYLTAVPKSADYLSLYTRFIGFNNKKEAVNYILSRSEGNHKK